MFLLLALVAATPGLTFLDLFPGAQATGLAGCAAAVWSDPTVTCYNPAGLAFLDGDNFSLTHAHLQPKWADIPGAFYESFGFTTPLTDRLHFGLSGLFFIRGATEIFSFTDKESAGFDADIQFGCGFAVTKKIAVGIAPKYLYSMNIVGSGETKDWTVAADVGTLFAVRDWLALAAVVHNLGDDIRFDNGTDTRILPRRFTFGAKITPVAIRNFGLFLTPELTIPFDTTRLGAGIGAELHWRTVVYLRAGLRDDRYRRGFAYGLGFRYKRLTVDAGTDENLLPKRRMYGKLTLTFKS